ncbi:maleylacetate reductase [Mesorhizobium sp. A623]
MQMFIYEPLPTRVVFGRGARHQLREEVERLGGRRAIVLSTPGRGERLAADIAVHLGSLSAGVCPEAVMHTPVDATERSLAMVRESGADILVAIGGGSAIGLSKALALRTDLPQIVLPTTYAGSEMTPVLGETLEGRKTTQRTPKVLPETVIYDIDLTLTLPAKTSVTSGMNAIAHAVEALYATDGNPVLSLMAEEGIAKLASALPRIIVDLADAEGRADALYGAFLCGGVLGATTMALHHKLAHVLGGMFDLPHAETHAALLPHTAAYNAPAAPDAMERVARALRVSDAPHGLFNLTRSLGGVMTLRDLGMPEDGIGPAVEEALANPYWNPRPLEAHGLRHLLERAWSGKSPLTS